MTARFAAPRPPYVRALAALLAFSMALPAQAATALADQPLFATAGVPGNLALPLSVEFPTAVGAAHPNGTYAPASSYLGYFDPDKCYQYRFVDIESASSMTHFAPAGAATVHTCPGTRDHLWSGNYLNWATMQTIDPFRWALTGGYRVVDTADTTLLEKAWASGQGGTSNFPDRVVTTAADIQNATPFAASGNLTAYVQGRGQQANFVSSVGAGNGGLLGTYFNTSNLDAGGALPVLTRTETVNFDWGAGSPAPGIVNSDYFSVRWVAAQAVPTSGSYSFSTQSDDGVRLWVNGVLVIDNWTDHAVTTDTSANIALTAGDRLAVRMEYREAAGNAVAKLLWKTPGSGSYVAYTANDWWYAPVRIKVCDPSAAAGGIESNCKAYANGNYKPEGLMQQYANRIRYSVLGYLNDSNLYRDGAVLRARQKFVGPTYPRPGLPDASNSEQEWDPSTGVFVVNPDAYDASTTASVFGTPISNSGVLNYLNKFGEVNRGSYKTYDPVGELYYAALRYFRNLGNVAAWSDMTGASTATKAVWADGFPVITNWKLKNGVNADPIQYECQRNFILGIGDVNSHADKNVPGNTDTSYEPSVPPEVSADTSVNAVTATNKVGSLEFGISNFGSYRSYPNCCTVNAPYMAGLAYDANTKDIRPDMANPAGTVGQTVQTFWVDVLEGGFKASNQFYLAAKYGGMKAPVSFDPYSAGAALQESWWHTTTDTVGAQPRPDNYYTAGRPDQLVDGLTKAFASIASQLRAFSTSLSTALPQVSTSGNASFSAQYDAQTWTGEIIASELSFSTSTGEPSAVESWRFSTKLEAQAAGTGWNTARVMATFNPATGAGVPFRHASISTAQKLALDTSYRSGDDSSDYLNYLRGDRSQERGTAPATLGNPYRLRNRLLGDIVGAKAQAIAAPSFPFSNAANPGYTSFKTSKAGRQTVVYVGANDGTLHAVNGALTGGGAGSEIFAYLPSALFNGPTTPSGAANASIDGLGAFGNPTFTHRQYVNATPNVYDVDFARTSGGSGSANWRSVLIGGLGKGGKGYYAIDVTDPSTMTSESAVAGKVLWEFTDADLGFSFGEPVVVKTKKYGWVVIFGSGYNNGGAGAFFIVNPRTGALLEKRSTGAGSAASDAGLAHVNAFVLDGTDGTADAAYAGDLLGNLWRLDLTGTGASYPAPTRIAQLSDSAGTAQPVTSRPMIVIQPNTNRRFVTIGTGRLLDNSDIGSTQGQTYYALLDGTGTRFNQPSPAADLPSGVSFPLGRGNLVANADPLVGVTLGASSMGWYLELGNGTGSIGWRVVLDSAMFYGSVAVSATLPNGSACSPSGSSRDMNLDLGTGKSLLTSTTVDAVTGISTTTAIAYRESGSGITTRLRFVSVNGTIRLLAENSAGTAASIERRPLSPPVMRRLNWRELPLVD